MVTHAADVKYTQYDWALKDMQKPNKPKIIIFAKAPIAGYAKTRLIPALGSVGASKLHEKLVAHTLNHACSVKQASVQLHYSEAHPFFQRLAKRFPISLHQQIMGNLGEKVAHAFLHSSQPTLLMGSDCPSITTDLLDIAIECLEAHDAVVLPAEDGGYGLIGLRRIIPEIVSPLFEGIPWGTGLVMQETRNKLSSANVNWCEPALIWDVDTPTDLRRLQALSPDWTR